MTASYSGLMGFFYFFWSFILIELVTPVEFDALSYEYLGCLLSLDRLVIGGGKKKKEERKREGNQRYMLIPVFKCGFGASPVRLPIC